MGQITNIHASCVALGPGQGVLILGQSGAGKSALALGLMALGAQLVADDRVDIRESDGELWAASPEAIRGQIEARGVGILQADVLPQARVRLVVDLDQEETLRLPPGRQHVLNGISVPLVLKSQSRHFEAAILQFLKGGRIA